MERSLRGRGENSLGMCVIRSKMCALLGIWGFVLPIDRFVNWNVYGFNVICFSLSSA